MTNAFNTLDNARPTLTINRVIVRTMLRAKIECGRVAQPDIDAIDVLRDCLASATLDALESNDGDVDTVATLTGMPADYVALVAKVNGL